jgi:cellulose biosynthesis protein BcsQ
MVNDPTQAPAAFITFYSFKGGVGRSMALINVAGILAGRGFRVLALDLDLEAPGISYLMQEEAKQVTGTQPGFVDLLADACARGPEADFFALEPAAVVERYSYVYTVPEAIRQSDEGLLRIMPAGRLDGGYQARLDALALGQLYREGHGQPLITAFKEVLQEAQLFDFVLIDSRTGF